MDPEEFCGIIDSLSSNKDSAAEEEHKELCEKIGILDESMQQIKAINTNITSCADIV